MIRKHRIKKNITQKEIAKKLKVSQGYVSKLENKRINNINREIILKLSYILDIDATELLIWLLGN